MEKVTPLEKALYLIERGYYPLDTDPIKLSKIIEKRLKEVGDSENITNSLENVYHENNA